MAANEETQSPDHQSKERGSSVGGETPEGVRSPETTDVPSTTAPSMSTSTASSTTTTSKAKERTKSKKEKLPKLTLTALKDESVVECLFDTFKNTRITFLFGIKEDLPEDIAQKMVRIV